jgi:hypothetical protein
MSIVATYRVGSVCTFEVTQVATMYYLRSIVPDGVDGSATVHLGHLDFLPDEKMARALFNTYYHGLNEGISRQRNKTAEAYKGFLETFMEE